VDISLRAIALFFFVLLLTRTMGRRELSSLAPFDIILLVVLGDAIQQGLTQDDYSVTGALIAITTLALLQRGTSLVAFRFGFMRRLLEGEPVVIVQDGRLIESNLRRERLTAADVTEEARLNKIDSLERVKWAVLEPNGQISFIEK
jgi:uncharacterized membrane protein YcaP (DUF421 family)